MIRQAIGELPPKYQEAFRATRLKERSFEDVAEAMGLKPRMVRHYVSLALVYIRLRREGVDPEPEDSFVAVSDMRAIST